MASRLAQATCGVRMKFGSVEIEQNVAFLRRLLGQHVEARAADGSVLQRLGQRLLVDETAARRC